MNTNGNFVAPQHLNSIHQAIGNELCQTMAFVRDTLINLSAMRSQSAREYAELREANALINLMKNAGSHAPVRHDEIAWALSHVRSIFGHQASLQWAQLLEKAATMLDINLGDPQPMPMDMAHRIDNELALLARVRAA
jgi:hypothetical protein